MYAWTWILPLICFTLAGLWAICYAMIYRHCEFDTTRVLLQDSLPQFLLASSFGFGIGIAIQLTCLWHKNLYRVLEPIIVVLLAASIAGPMGWIFRNPYLVPYGDVAIFNAACWGGAIGFGLYLLEKSKLIDLKCIIEKMQKHRTDRL